MSKIEQNVMGSVALIFAARTLTSGTALKLYALVASAWGIGRLVWVSKVLENFFMVERSGAGAVANFMLASVAHAHLSVQLVLLAAIIAAVSLLLDVTRAAPGGARLAA